MDCNFNKHTTRLTSKVEEDNRDAILLWLRTLNLEEYWIKFKNAGYDLPTISRMTPEDLIAIGIMKPGHRKRLRHSISRMPINNGIPNYIPSTVLEWLYLLGLENYHASLLTQGYCDLDQVMAITWEDLEDIGILKLGHQKKVMLAINQLNRIKSQQSFQNLDFASRYRSGSLSLSNSSVTYSNKISIETIRARKSRSCESSPCKTHKMVTFQGLSSSDNSSFSRTSTSLTSSPSHSTSSLPHISHQKRSTHRSHSNDRWSVRSLDSSFNRCGQSFQNTSNRSCFSKFSKPVARVVAKSREMQRGYGQHYFHDHRCHQIHSYHDDTKTFQTFKPLHGSSNFTEHLNLNFHSSCAKRHYEQNISTLKNSPGKYSSVSCSVVPPMNSKIKSNASVSGGLLLATDVFTSSLQETAPNNQYSITASALNENCKSALPRLVRYSCSDIELKKDLDILNTQSVTPVTFEYNFGRLSREPVNSHFSPTTELGRKHSSVAPNLFNNVSANSHSSTKALSLDSLKSLSEKFGTHSIAYYDRNSLEVDDVPPSAMDIITTDYHVGSKFNTDKTLKMDSLTDITSNNYFASQEFLLLLDKKMNNKLINTNIKDEQNTNSSHISPSIDVTKGVDGLLNSAFNTSLSGENLQADYLIKHSDSVNDSSNEVEVNGPSTMTSHDDFVSNMETSSDIFQDIDKMLQNLEDDVDHMIEGNNKKPT